MGFEAIYTRLWMLPDISNGLYVNIDRGEVQFGRDAFRTPALFTFNQPGEVTQANLGDPLAEETLSKAVLSLPNTTRYIWFDECRLLAHLDPVHAESSSDGLCYVHGRRGAAARFGAVANRTYFSAEELAAMLEVDGASELADDDTAALERIGRARGDFPVSVPLPALMNGGRGVLIRSSAFEAGASFVRRQTIENLDAGEDWVIDRGVTLLGIAPDGRAEQLDRLDQCNPDFDPASHAAWDERIRESSAKFLTHLVVVHDSAHCGIAFDTWAAPLSGLALEGLRSLQPRQAYAAVIDGQGGIREFPDGGFGRIALFLTPELAVQAAQTVLAASADAAAPTIAASPETPLRSVTEAATTTAAPSEDAQVSAVAASDMVPESAACIAPTSASTESPSAALVPGARLSGSAYTMQIGFPSGWWDQEAEGRWSGAQLSQLMVILPEGPAGLRLALELVSHADRARNVRVEHDGRLIGSASISMPAAIGVEVGDLPRGMPVLLNLVIEGEALDCPVARGAGSDARRLGMMLKSVMLEISDPAAEALGLATAEGTPSSITGPESGCVEPDPNRVLGKAASAMPMSRSVPIAAALETSMLGLGAGWWEPEEFGVWLGTASANFELILPSDVADVWLSLWVAPFGVDDIAVRVSYAGREIKAGFVGVDRPLDADVSALPRDVPITLSLSLPGSDVLGCPASRNAGGDTRTLGLMLHALSLSASSEPLFTASIAHGGGRYRGEAITNSFEAIDANLLRFNVFELDFNWTADGQLICIHDWQKSFTSRFGAETDRAVEFETFQQLLSASPDRTQNCDLDTLAEWMRRNPEIRVVTDVKERPVEAHVMIAERHPELLRQFVPQTFQPDEIDRYRTLGYRDVIWTLYRFGEDAEAVVRKTMTHLPSAVAISASMAEGGLLGILRNATSVPVYVHTVNDPSTAACLLASGAAGIYSDDLTPDEVTALRGTSGICN